jgi:hypothetical protein
MTKKPEIIKAVELSPSKSGEEKRLEQDNGNLSSENIYEET